MGALFSLPQRLLNFLLPFTDKSTPFYQDIIHTLILCGTLYFAPQLIDIYNQRINQHDPSSQNDVPETDPAPEPINNDLPVDHGFILQPDEDDEVPPLVPTPPLGIAQPALPFLPQDQNHDPPAWPNNLQNENEAPGPAHDRPRPTPANRVVGTKKAKSLARKDQRRAYHEFHRQEAELRRLREAEGKEEREAALAAEKARRAEVEREIQERERVERERKKEVERREQEDERLRRERVVSSVREGVEGRGAVDLNEVAESEGRERMWVERLVRASGLLSQYSAPGTYVLITEGGWVVRVDKELMREVYASAAAFGDGNGGRCSLEEFGGILEDAVRVRVDA